MTDQPFPGFHLVRHPLADLKVSALRDKATPPPEFRRLLQELSQLVAYEALRDFETQPVTVQTPLGPAPGARATRPLVLIPVLRAGLAMSDGILRMFPSAAVGHIGMFRDEETLEPVSYYFRLPPEPARPTSCSLTRCWPPATALLPQPTASKKKGSQK